MHIYIRLFCIVSFVFLQTIRARSAVISEDDKRYDWIQTARIFLMDAYQPPFAPELEYNADDFAELMAEMNVNVIRFGTMGKYATIQGIRFSVHPDQGDRDLLQETIDACKPKGIKVIPYISTGHKLAWSMVTGEYPGYARQTTPYGGLPDRSHMYVGEDHGTVCWMGPYRKAYFDYVEHVVRDYDIDAVYFDAWFPRYFWGGNRVCYCEGCRNGFRKATGLELPYHENDDDYTAIELETIRKYHEWYDEEFMSDVMLKIRELIKSYKDVPLISNINNPQRMASQDPRINSAMDAFLYERGHSILERAEGVGVPRSVGLHVWPYIGTYHNWPRLAFQALNYQQEIFINLMFGGGSIVAQPTGYIYHAENRKYVSYPFGIIEKNEKIYKGLQNYPGVAVLFEYKSLDNHVKRSSQHGMINARSASLGAFAACLYNHVQVSSISEFVLDNPALLNKYPLLYLANVPVLSDERVNNIKEYVRNGGSLIATYNTTMFDDEGNSLSRFKMEDLLRVRPLNPKGELADIIESYRAMVGGPNDLYMKVSENGKGYFNSEARERLYPNFYYEPVEVLDGGKVIMDIVTGYNERPVLPGIVISEYGKGKVIYCSSTLESLYNSEGPDLVGELIKQIVEISSTSSPYSIEAPESLISNLAYKENTLVLHMTNCTGNKFEKPWRNEYYMAPVDNVKLKIDIPVGRKVKNVSTIVDSEYKMQISEEYVELFFPSIDAYQAVVIELN